MENEVILREKDTRTAKEIKAQVNLIQDVMQKVMIRDVHYGAIPGCGEKPTLLKAGAEKILMTFRLCPEIVVEDLSDADIVRYRVTANIKTADGSFVGSGIGECSSGEDKYKWRAPVCPEEYDETPEDRRREKWSKGWGSKPAYKKQQIRTNKEDIANTVLKMAKKRALVDATLTTTAASDCFSQDYEDMPEEIRDEFVSDEPVVKKPEQPKQQKQSTNGKPVSPAQLKAVRAIAYKLNIGDALDVLLMEKYGVETPDGLTLQQASEIISTNGACLNAA